MDVLKDLELTVEREMTKRLMTKCGVALVIVVVAANCFLSGIQAFFHYRSTVELTEAIGHARDVLSGTQWEEVLQSGTGVNINRTDLSGTVNYKVEHNGPKNIDSDLPASTKDSHKGSN